MFWRIAHLATLALLLNTVCALPNAEKRGLSGVEDLTTNAKRMAMGLAPLPPARRASDSGLESEFFFCCWMKMLIVDGFIKWLGEVNRRELLPE